MKILLLLILAFVWTASTSNRGAQIRITKSGMQYGAKIGIQTVERELKNRRLPSQRGNHGPVHFSAENLMIHYLRVGRFNVEPVPGVGLRIAVSGVSLSAQGRVQIQFRQGWVRIGETTNIKAKLHGVSFTIVSKIGASGGKPTLHSHSCSSHVNGLDINFSGGLGWIYNMFVHLLKGHIKNVIKDMMCGQAKSLTAAFNKFLGKFPVKQNIANWAILDYSFEKPNIAGNYIDLLLRGEFLDVKNPVRSSIPPPRLNTITSSGKMAYVWISDFTLNSGGKVFHDAGLLQNVVSPLITNGLIPASLRPFLNTKSFEKLIPQLYEIYPDHPLQFALKTYQPPKFDFTAGSGHVRLFVQATANVIHPNKTSTSLFYLKMSVNAVGSVQIVPRQNDLVLAGNVANFSFSASVGGSVLGPINIPFDDPAIKDLVRGLVIDQANPILKRGFPVPKINGLSVRNPTFSIIKDAIRVDTDIMLG